MMSTPADPKKTVYLRSPYAAPDGLVGADARAAERYESLCGGEKTAELIAAHRALTAVLRKRLCVRHGGITYTWSRGDDSFVRSLPVKPAPPTRVCGPAPTKVYRVEFEFAG